MTNTENCWKCESNLISVNNYSPVRVTHIICVDCGFTREYAVCEESAIKLWNKEAKESKLSPYGLLVTESEQEWLADGCPRVETVCLYDEELARVSRIKNRAR
jgi:hypothetical protein